MSENRLDAAFAAQVAAGRSGLIPYVTGGFPNPNVTGALLERFDALGVTAVEIGFPFSDSIADGPVIQDSFHRALAGGLKTADLFRAVEQVRKRVRSPLIAMVSASIVTRMGTVDFVTRAADAGFDGLIVPDAPLEETDPLFEAAANRNLRYIQLVSTTTPPDRAARIVERCGGFVYQIAAAGTTGERNRLTAGLADHVRRLRGTTRLPICVGFGIATPDQVRQAAGWADGVIVGSAIVRRIAAAVDAGAADDQVVESTAGFVAELVAALPSPIIGGSVRRWPSPPGPS